MCAKQKPLAAGPSHRLAISPPMPCAQLFQRVLQLRHEDQLAMNGECARHAAERARNAYIYMYVYMPCMYMYI